MKKWIVLSGLLLVAPLAAFADLGVGAITLGKSPALVGQPDNTNSLNVGQFGIGGDARLKLGWFQGSGTLLYTSGSGVNSLDSYLDAGWTGDLGPLRLSLGAGPNFVFNSGANTGAQVGLNTRAGADIMLGKMSLGLTYIMALNLANGVQINTGAGLLGLNVMFWF
jgi:hypothetical protein